MGVVRRAFLYVTRKRLRSVLLFLIFLVAGLFLLIGISIKQSAKVEADNFRKTLTTGLRIESTMPSASKVLEEWTNEKGELVYKYNAPFIREYHIEEFLAIEGVSGFYCEDLQREDIYTGLKLQPGCCTRWLDIIDGRPPFGGEATEQERQDWQGEDRAPIEADAQTNSFIPTYDSQWHPAFVNGGVELVEGRHIRIGDVAKVIISDEVAERNGLKIGDTVTPQRADIWTGERYGRTYEMEIVGIFHVNFEQKVMPEYTFECDILANTFFSTPEIYERFRYDYQVQYGYTVISEESDKRLCCMVLFVEDPAYLDSVKEQVLAIDSVGWDDYYMMEIYDKDYRTAAAPLLTMMKISNVLTVASVIGVLWILFLVLTIWMRSRKYETGILSSIGVKKSEILLQFLIECCTIALAAFLAAVLLAGPVTNLVGDGLQTLIYSAGDSRGYEVFIEPGTSDIFVNLLPPAKGETLPYAVTFGEACIVCLLLVGTAVAAVFASSVKVLERKPQEILYH